MKARVIGALLLAALAVPSASAAPRVEIEDGNDTRGTFDVRSVIATGDDKRNFRVTTFAEWRVGEINERGFFLVRFDTFGDDRFDYYVLARPDFDSNRMHATLHRDRRKKKDFKITGIQVWRADLSSITVRVPLSRMRFATPARTYSWQAQSLWTSRRCARVCFDLVPDKGSIRDVAP